MMWISEWYPFILICVTIIVCMCVYGIALSAFVHLFLNHRQGSQTLKYPTKEPTNFLLCKMDFFRIHEFYIHIILCVSGVRYFFLYFHAYMLLWYQNTIDIVSFVKFFFLKNKNSQASLKHKLSVQWKWNVQSKIAHVKYVFKKRSWKNNPHMS